MQERVSNYPRPRNAWSVVGFLTIAYFFSYIDRYVLGLLIEPIKADLGLTDTQMGLLLGPAFGLLYATTALPIGYFVDRKQRTWIVAGGIAFWSLACAFCGLAKNFVQLFIARMSVGIGEAVLNPAAFSIIADSFPKEKRGRPIAFYSMALSLGAGTASIVGAGILLWSKTTDQLSLPYFGALEPWQLVFLVVSLPGLFLALVFFAIREPARQASNETIKGKSEGNLVDTVGYIGLRWLAFVTLISIYCVMLILAFTHQWHASLFARTWGWETSKYALYNGITLLAIGPISVNFAGWLSDRWLKKGRTDAPVLIAFIGLAIIIPTEILKSLVSTGEMAIAFLAINTVGFAFMGATGVIALLNITPSTVRGQTVAVYYMCISLSGLFIGPPIIGFFSDYVFGPEEIRYAFIAVAVIFGIPILLAAPFILRIYRREFAFRLSDQRAT